MCAGRACTRADLVKGILTNLLENAADAAGTNGTILTITSLQGDQAVVEVHDSGPGISDEASRRSSNQPLPSRSTAWDLACRSHERTRCCWGGDITLVKGELGGAGFRVTLPAAQDSPGSRSSNSVRRQPTVASRRTLATHEAQTPHRHRRRAEHRSSLRLILQGEGYGVTICSSVAEFQPHRAPGRADLYLLDVRLPDGNGIDVLRSLKQNEDPTPVVMIPGHATIRDAVEATRSGAFDFWRNRSPGIASCW